jgi:hypothetical protein
MLDLVHPEEFLDAPNIALFLNDTKCHCSLSFFLRVQFGQVLRAPTSTVGTAGATIRATLEDAIVGYCY